jgi:hypothetical protein
VAASGRYPTIPSHPTRTLDPMAHRKHRRILEPCSGRWRSARLTPASDRASPTRSTSRACRLALIRPMVRTPAVLRTTRSPSVRAIRGGPGAFAVRRRPSLGGPVGHTTSIPLLYENRLGPSSPGVLLPSGALQRLVSSLAAVRRPHSLPYGGLLPIVAVHPRVVGLRGGALKKRTVIIHRSPATTLTKTQRAPGDHPHGRLLPVDVTL